jgi:serine protease Do
MVVDVTQGGPSEGTIKEGDVILDFNGRPIVQMRDLPRFVAETAVGTKVMVHVLRNGAETDVDVTLGRLENNNVVVADAAPKDPGLKDVPDATTPAGLIDIVGFNVIQLDAASRDEFGFEADVDGVAISDVKSGTDADEKGLTPGLVVAEVNQQPISDVAGVEALVNAAREAGRPAVLLKVIDHQGGSHFLAVKLN